MRFDQLADLYKQIDHLPSAEAESSKDIYMKRIAVAYEPKDISHEVLDLFHRLAPDHEIQLLTDGTPEHCWAIGIGDNDHVNMSAEAKTELRERYEQMRLTSSKPIYLIHNHPPAQDNLDTLPSPSDIEYFSQLPSGLIPAVYTNSTRMLLAYPYDT